MLPQLALRNLDAAFAVGNPQQHFGQPRRQLEE
jgi:hypothetical protein